MGDKDDRFAGLLPDPQQTSCKLSRASARRARQKARPSAAHPGRRTGCGRSQRAASCRRKAGAGSGARNRKVRPGPGNAAPDRRSAPAAADRLQPELDIAERRPPRKQRVLLEEAGPAHQQRAAPGRDEMTAFRHGHGVAVTLLLANHDASLPIAYGPVSRRIGPGIAPGATRPRPRRRLSKPSLRSPWSRSLLHRSGLAPPTLCRLSRQPDNVLLALPSCEY
jgi:hypothetical protein